jgi:hypothetical protein
VGVIVIEQEQFTAPQDHLGNAAFTHHMISHLQAVELQQLADFARACENDEFAYLEVAAQLHISDRAAQRRLKFARTLTERLPETFAALQQGWIEEYKAQLIAQAVEPLSDEHARAVEDTVLSKAGKQTPIQLRNRLAKVVMAVDPEGAEQRRQEKRRDRHVASQPAEDGQATLIIRHDAERIAQMHAVITGHAHHLKALGGEPRTTAQLEADIACDLILGHGNHTSRVVEVHLTLPATTAAGLNNQPGDVDGMPITAQAAREMMAEASRWRWLRTDPTTGVPVDLTSARYTPPASLATWVKVRDRTCRFPGCTRPAKYCEIDHRTPWPQGETSDTNCACLCKRHHKAKHEAGWTLRMITPEWPEWTSPHGFTHTVEPEPATPPTPPPPADPDPDPPPF